jgi:hypothetical protein
VSCTRQPGVRKGKGLKVIVPTADGVMRLTGSRSHGARGMCHVLDDSLVRKDKG